MQTVLKACLPDSELDNAVKAAEERTGRVCLHCQMDHVADEGQASS